MLLQAGKRYVMRNGAHTGVIKPNDIPCQDHDTYKWSDGARTNSWTAEGQFLDYEVSDLDIVSEYADPGSSTAPSTVAQLFVVLDTAEGSMCDDPFKTLGEAVTHAEGLIADGCSETLYVFATVAVVARKIVTTPIHA